MSKTKILTNLWGEVVPSQIESYAQKGGYSGLEKSLEMTSEQIIDQVKKAGLQGRGGAGFPTGQKWEIAQKQKSQERYFICNLDESEPGTFKDRLLAENNPHQIIEGIIISARAVGAQKAYLYLNGNFKIAKFLLERAVEQAYEKNLLGQNIQDTDFNLDLEVFFGAGAYICGEESALINSIEGKRGEPRKRPPFACECGLFGRPTVVNNAETISNIPWIIQHGGEKYAQLGQKSSSGSKLFCVDGAVKTPGIFEAPLGTSLRELIFEKAGGMQSGAEFWFAQVGGSSGRLALTKHLDQPLGYFKDAEIPLGSGAILVLDKNADVKNWLLSVTRFFFRESCGQCVPCREGTFRLKQIIERWEKNDFTQDDFEDLEKIIYVLKNSTFCALGKFAATAVNDAIDYGFLGK